MKEWANAHVGGNRTARKSEKKGEKPKDLLDRRAPMLSEEGYLRDNCIFNSHKSRQRLRSRAQRSGECCSRSRKSRTASQKSLTGRDTVHVRARSRRQCSMNDKHSRKNTQPDTPKVFLAVAQHPVVHHRLQDEHRHALRKLLPSLKGREKRKGGGGQGASSGGRCRLRHRDRGAKIPSQVSSWNQEKNKQVCGRRARNTGHARAHTHARGEEQVVQQDQEEESHSRKSGRQKRKQLLHWTSSK